MQRWEYLFLVFQDDGDNWKLRYVNHQEQPNWKKGALVASVANQLGNDGWELISDQFTYYSILPPETFTTDSRKLIFKHPKL